MVIEVYGIYKGYSGLLEGNIQKLNLSSVGNIIQRGGTLLDTSRCLEFHTPEIRQEAVHILAGKHIDTLIVIGGNGSFAGAMTLHQEHDIPVIGIPGTIDNDISGTDYTIGFNTAVQTAVNAVDNIRDTAWRMREPSWSKSWVANHPPLPCKSAYVPGPSMWCCQIRRSITKRLSTALIKARSGVKPHPSSS